ncbi:MAG TPA: hypothetical protein VFW92_01085 [Candidatus Limnocylindrales bacterium]|nr:hypothetical protein [Candidatus Limnocylindrales bacterium]
MNGLSNALHILTGLGTAKVATGIVAVTAAATLVVGPAGVLPPAAGSGPTNPIAIAAKGDHPSPPRPSAITSPAATSSPSASPAGSPAADDAHAAVLATLEANEARLRATLQGVRDKLVANGHANDHALAALAKLLDRIDSQQMGLDKARSAIESAGSGQASGTPSPHPTHSLPPQAMDHPTPPAHP